MKNQLLLALAGALLAAGMATAQPAPQIGGHYPAGVEGIKAATLPPPGVYFRDYNQWYFADDLDNGPPGDFDVFAYINAPRLIWITDSKILGGSYGMDALIPLGYSSVEAGSIGLDDSRWSIGDLFLEPITLSWHTKRFDAAVGYGVWAPTGGFDAGEPAGLGKGFWSHMFTVGATCYLDEQKTWSLSVLNRYEIHHEHEDFDITPGNTWTVEFGLGKSVTKAVEVGLAGYYQTQVTDDDPDSGLKDHVLALGPEINAFCPKLGMFFSLRYLREFGARDRTEGNLFTLTLTKPF